jgi:hypothetical protein
MRALAEFAMRGRREAVLVAVAGAAIPMFFWVGAAVVGLVTLRRGLRDGALVLMWAVLPALGLAWFGEILPVAALLGTVVLAWLLRWSMSWPWTLCGAAVLGLLLSVGLQTIGRDYLVMVEQAFATFFEGVAKQASDPAAREAIRAPTGVEIAGMFGLMHCATLVACLVLARWWQAQLYNPGGLRQELHALRMSPLQVLGLLAVAVLLYQLGPGFRVWAWTPLVPMLVAGIGLVHALLAGRAGAGWVGLFWAVLVVLPPVKQIVVALAAMDGWLDLRRRWAARPPRDGDGGED